MKVKKPVLKRILILSLILLLLPLIGIAAFVSIIFYIDKYAKKYIFTDLTQIPEADAILVLGAFVIENERPSNVLADRLNNALVLYNAGKAPRIILSGDHGAKYYNEVGVMRDYLLERGVPREDLFLDHAGFNTYDSMYRARDIFGAESLIISTQQFHISRAVYIARRLGIEAYGYPDTRWLDFYERRYGLRERFAKVKAFIDVEITRRKPRFLGEQIPLDSCGLLTEG